ncbi:hypothetical protein ACFL6W_05665 [Thermodesulfobacteriota bacterium]
MYKKQNIVMIISIIVICGLVFSGYIILKSRHEKELDNIRRQEEEAWNSKTELLQDKVTGLEKEISVLSGNISEELDISGDLEYTPGPGGMLEKGTEESLRIEDIERRIASFFLRLDEQGYIKQYELKGSSYGEYEALIEKLSLKTPLIVNETESLYNMFLNIAHFYRTLGKNRLTMVRDVLINEHDIIESTMRDFYLWYTYDYGGEKKIKGRPSTEVLYEYAGFFLNTIGGRNYLMRRDSKLRILTAYYSILFLDKANDLKKNPHGIDIRPHLRMLLNDVSTYTGFKYKFEYIKQINGLKKKYRVE